MIERLLVTTFLLVVALRVGADDQVELALRGDGLAAVTCLLRAELGERIDWPVINRGRIESTGLRHVAATFSTCRHGSETVAVRSVIRITPTGFRAGLATGLQDLVWKDIQPTNDAQRAIIEAALIATAVAGAKAEAIAGERNRLEEERMRVQLAHAAAQHREQEARWRAQEQARLAREESEAREHAEAQAILADIIAKHVRPEHLHDVETSTVRIGMTQQEALLAWGVPDHIKKTVTPAGEEQHWTYGENWVRITNGIVDSGSVSVGSLTK